MQVSMLRARDAWRYCRINGAAHDYDLPLPKTLIARGSGRRGVWTKVGNVGGRFVLVTVGGVGPALRVVRHQR